MTEEEYRQLDLAVARTEVAAGKLDVKISDGGVATIMMDLERWEPFRPSVNAAHAWPIIEEHWSALVATLQRDCGDSWATLIAHDAPLLVSFMRAYVAMRSPVIVRG